MNVIQSNIPSRLGFPLLCNQRGLLTSAVEIGTHLGIYASDFLIRWHGQVLFTVDHYADGVEVGGNRELQRREAADRLSIFGPRAAMLRMASVEAACLFVDGSLDFIHIDGGHDGPSVRDDIAAWWPKMRPGGLMTGHDWCGYYAGLMESVRRHAESVGLPIHIIREHSGHNSWMIEAPR